MSDQKVFKRTEVVVDRLVVLSVAGCCDGGRADDGLLREERLTRLEQEVSEGRAALARERAQQQAALAHEREQALAAARTEGDTLKRAAQASAEGIRAAAEQAGRAAGEAAGRAAVAERLRGVLDALDGLLARAEAQRAAQLAAAADDIIRLAVEVARKVARDAVAIDREAVVRNLTAALDRARGQSLARVRVSPADYEMLSVELGERMPELRTANVALIADPEIEDGGAIVETEFGSIDATLAGQLAVLENSLLAAAAAEPAGAPAESAPAGAGAKA